MKNKNPPKNSNRKNITTIKINRQTKQRLDRLKEHERETYEQVLKKILYILNLSKTNPEKAQQILRKIDSIIKLRQSEYNEVYQEEKKISKEGEKNEL